MRLITKCIFASFVFVIVAGCVSTDQVNTTNNTTNYTGSPVYPGYNVYKNSTYNFSIEYPANWTIAEGVGDNYTYPPGTLTYIVTFYPPNDSLSSRYDKFTIAFDNPQLLSSDPITLEKYNDFGLKYFNEEIPSIISINKSFTNVGSYPAIQENFTYKYYYERLHGMTLFIIADEYIDGGAYKVKICRLEYSASVDTFDNHLKTVQNMLDTFKLNV